MNIQEIDGATSLTFYCGDLPADEAITAAGHEANGYFWEGIVRYSAPDLASRVELDPEAGMFAAHGDRATVDRLRAAIGSCLDNGARVAATVREAEAADFEFDD